MECKDKCRGIRDTATFIMTEPIESENKLKNFYNHKKEKDIPYISSIDKYRKRRSEYIKDKNERKIIDLKLLSIETIYKMLNRCSIYNQLLPINLEKMIKRIRKDDIPISKKNEFLRHIRYMIQQRFSGSQFEESLGVEEGISGQMGGFQKMVLAAESIPCMAICNTNIAKTDCIIVFEHAHEFETHFYPKDLLYSDNQIEMPIIIHMPMVKYDPYYWIFSLHELGEHISDQLSEEFQIKYSDFNKYKNMPLNEFYSILGMTEHKKVIQKIEKLDNKYEKKRAFEEIESRINRWGREHNKLKTLPDYYDEIGRETIPDFFVCKHIDKEVYEDIFSEYSPKRRLDIMLRLALIDKTSITKKSSIKKYSNALEKGIIIDDLSDKKEFFSYVQAYIRLEKNKRENGKALSSFVMSLFNLRLQIQKDIIKNN
jgi:hypothetical protein